MVLYSDEDFLLDVVHNEKSNRKWLRIGFFDDGHYIEGRNIELSIKDLQEIHKNLGEFINKFTE